VCREGSDEGDHDSKGGLDSRWDLGTKRKVNQEDKRIPLKVNAKVWHKFTELTKRCKDPPSSAATEPENRQLKPFDGQP